MLPGHRTDIVPLCICLLLYCHSIKLPDLTSYVKWKEKKKKTDPYTQTHTNTVIHTHTLRISDNSLGCDATSCVPVATSLTPPLHGHTHIPVGQVCSPAHRGEGGIGGGGGGGLWGEQGKCQSNIKAVSPEKTVTLSAAAQNACGAFCLIISYPFVVKWWPWMVQSCCCDYLWTQSFLDEARPSLL